MAKKKAANVPDELAQRSAGSLQIYGKYLGDTPGCQDYTRDIPLAGVRIVDEQYLLELFAKAQKFDKALAALEKLTAVARDCEQIASSYSPCIDSVEEHGGDDHEDPSCAIHHRLYYAMFDAERAIAKAKGGAPC